MWGTISWLGLALIICGGLATCNYNNNLTSQKALEMGYTQIPNPANSNEVIWVKGK